ncbi:GEL complex subunit OPTI isoform X1 [Erinaceus europaeus]|uniref:GEL complex subunit OPTI isoform X1 n=1 Tax=Erinaceus europaeus TaxID=9365 RepID=A0ABM3X9I3_ERIEU|nr:GEL complex subunit OPTI isoform X1 [Erinaceus europaeus]
MSGGRRKEEPPQPQLANGALKVSVWSKVLRSDAAWEDKDEFLDVIYWFRQIIAVVLGVIWGVLPLRGFLGIAGSFGSSFTLPSTMTDVVQPPPATCPVQRTLLVTAQKHDCRGRASKRKGACSTHVLWTKNQCVGHQCFLQGL